MLSPGCLDFLSFRSIVAKPGASSMREAAATEKEAASDLSDLLQVMGLVTLSSLHYFPGVLSNESKLT